MDELQKFVEDMENLGYSVNARNEFYAFIEAIDSNEKLIKECQKIYHLLDEIVLLDSGKFSVSKLNKTLLLF